MDLLRNVSTAVILSTLLAVGACGDQREDALATEPSGSSASVPTTTPTPPPTTTGRSLPDNFPLLDGYPGDHHAEPRGGYGSEGPGRHLKALVLEACGVRAPSPAYVDQLRAGWNNVEDYRARQHTLFESPAQAQEWADSVLETYRACPEEGPQNDIRRTTVRPGTLGDESGIASTLYSSAEGAPLPGLTMLYVVRVDAAVLVSSTYNEGGAGPDPEREVSDQSEYFADEMAGVVSAMSDLGTSEAEPSAGRPPGRRPASARHDHGGGRGCGIRDD